MRSSPTKVASRVATVLVSTHCGWTPLSLLDYPRIEEQRFFQMQVAIDETLQKISTGFSYPSQNPDKNNSR